MKLLFTYGHLFVRSYQLKSTSLKSPSLYTYNTRKTIFLKVYQVTNKLFSIKNTSYAKRF